MRTYDADGVWDLATDLDVRIGDDGTVSARYPRVYIDGWRETRESAWQVVGRLAPDLSVEAARKEVADVYGK